MKTLPIIEADNLAERFRFAQGIAPCEPINIKTLVRRLGITAVYRPLSETSYGVGCKSSDGKLFILINSNNCRGRQHFTAAHELYHLFYEEHPVPHMCGVTVTSEEKNANRFASSLLMPKGGLLMMISAEEIASNTVSLATVLRMEQYFRVSRASLLFRLKDLNLISVKWQKELESYPVKDSARAYGYDLTLYEKGNEGLVIGDFGEKAKRLFDLGKISEGHYVELLNMISNAGQKD